MHKGIILLSYGGGIHTVLLLKLFSSKLYESPRIHLL